MKTNNKYISDTTPAKSGIFNVLYTRAKSTTVAEGTARFSKRATGTFEKGWSSIINNRTKRLVKESYDSRDNKTYSPHVQGWTVAQ